MSVKRLVAIGFIFAMTATAWFILGSSLLVRSAVKDRDTSRVEERWGRPLTQRPPMIRNADATAAVAPESSEVNVDLKLDYRRLGLLWYSTYTVVVDGIYEVKNPGATEATYTALFEPPTQDNSESRAGSPAALRLDDFAFEPVGAGSSRSGDTVLSLSVPAGESRKFHVHYKSQGLNTWRYALGDNVQHVSRFALTATTNFRDVDFTTLSPTEPKEQTADGWRLAWKYVSTRAAGLTVTIDMPQRQNPGELAGRITYFAPVSLLFFFTVMVVITVMKRIEIHPMNYCFIAAGFFAFHLLLSYLVDHVDVHAAFFVGAAASVFLVVSYLRLVTGTRFALLHAGVSQVVFLVGFSYAFFYEGFTGLAVTVGSVVTLFVLMQVTGRVKWSEVFAAREPAMYHIPPRPVKPAEPGAM